MRTALLLLALLIAQPAYASVIITEIAWMGDAASADNEWIELHNTGTNPVSLEGWRLGVTNLGSDEEAFSISLKGTLEAFVYDVLERTNDESAPGTAFMTYAGALVNTGATLSLYDAQGKLMDRVAGGEGWEQVKGDNSTKQTAQKTSGGWISASPTPGTPPSSQPEEEYEQEEEEEQDTDHTAETSIPDDEEPVTIELTLPDTRLVIEVEVPSRAYVNQTIDLAVSASGVGRTHLNSLSHEWNFGDLATASGKEVSHAYAYPGEYVVTLKSSFGRHSDTARAHIVVLPVSFSVTWTSSGLLHIHNDAKYEIDISGYTLTSGRELVFPEGTILLPNATLTLSQKQLNAKVHTPVTLSDPLGTVVARSDAPAVSSEDVEDIPAIASVAYAATNIDPPSPVVSGNFSFKKEVIEEEREEIETAPLVRAQEDRALPDQAQENTQEQWPYMALAGVLGLGCLGVLASRIR